MIPEGCERCVVRDACVPHDLPEEAVRRRLCEEGSRLSNSPKASTAFYYDLQRRFCYAQGPYQSAGDFHDD